MPSTAERILGPVPSAAEMLTFREACDYLNVSVPTLRRLVYRRLIRHYKPTGALLFAKADLDAHLAASVVEPVGR